MPVRDGIVAGMCWLTSSSNLPFGTATVARHCSVTLKTLEAVTDVGCGDAVHGAGATEATRGAGEKGNIGGHALRKINCVGPKLTISDAKKGHSRQCDAMVYKSDHMKQLQEEVKQQLQVNLESLQNRVTAANLRSI